MGLAFDPAKRERTLRERGLDFAEAETIFEGPVYTFQDKRHDYGEVRWTTYGLLGGRQVIVIWTWRGDDRHVISLRKSNDREKARHRSRVG
ncbi:MAG TPA: BrnT family toxin [Allosphingosinicella sp.]|nr:BrnT family toxin [Allosphingosinicella sp.]